MQVAEKREKSAVQRISDNWTALQDDAVAEEQKQVVLGAMAAYVRNTEPCR